MLVCLCTFSWFLILLTVWNAHRKKHTFISNIVFVTKIDVFSGSRNSMETRCSGWNSLWDRRLRCQVESPGTESRPSCGAILLFAKEGRCLSVNSNTVWRHRGVASAQSWQMVHSRQRRWHHGVSVHDFRASSVLATGVETQKLLDGKGWPLLRVHLTEVVVACIIVMILERWHLSGCSRAQQAVHHLDYLIPSQNSKESFQHYSDLVMKFRICKEWILPL